MLRRSAVSRSFFTVVREELGKLPAYLSYRMQSSAQQHVDSAAKTFDFLKGNSPNDTPEMREKKQKHREMYEALMKEQQAQAAELAAKRKANLAAMSWTERAKALARETKEALQQMTSAKAGAMALLQHCTASHAAEVAVEQGIDVKNVRMALEKQQKSNSIEYEEVVVGYIDAPSASDEEVMAFAEKLHKACPVANSMHVEWKRDVYDDAAASRSTPAAAADNGMSSSDRQRVDAGVNDSGAPSVDYATFAQQGMGSFQRQQGDGGAGNGATQVSLGMPGSRRYAKFGDGAFDDEESFHLPGVKRKRGATTKTTATSAEAEMPYGMPGNHRLRTSDRGAAAEGTAEKPPPVADASAGAQATAETESRAEGEKDSK